MFTGKSLMDVFHAGGYTMYVLLGCSVLSLAIIIERIWAYAKLSVDLKTFMALIRDSVDSGNFAEALNVCDRSNTPVSAVVKAGIEKKDKSEREITGSMQRQAASEIVRLERFTGIVGTIGGIAVYIGLFGTVLGIIRAFGSLVQLGPEGTVIVTAGITTVIPGIAEALVCTAAGLFVAVPAVIGYNYFSRKIDRFNVQMEIASSELADMFSAKKK